MSPDPYHRAEKALVSLDKRTHYDERNRLALLCVHGVMGVVVGYLMAAYGTPDAWIMRFGPDNDLWLAGPAFCGGLILLSSLFIFDRHLVGEAIGMAMILAWDLGMAYILWDFGLNPYAVAVYVGMGALMCIHVYTLAMYVWYRRGVS